MTLRGRLSVVAVIVAAVGGGCGWVSSSVEVLDARVSPDGASISVAVETCGAESSVRVKESTESVTLYAMVRGGSDEECTDMVTVVLEEPLGTRRLIDGYDFTLLEAGS